MRTKFTLVMALIIACFTTGNAQWTTVNTHCTQGLNCIALSGNNGVIGGNSGNFIYSSDAGVTWSDSDYYPYDAISAVAYASASTVSAGSLGDYYSSTNSGVGFTPPTHFGTFGTYKDIVFTSSSNGFAIDDYCDLATTTNGGQTWAITAHPCGANSPMNDLDFPTASIGYACGANGNVRKTTDGGTTWSAVTAPSIATVAYFDIQFLDTSTGFISGRTNTAQDTLVFKKTTDGGTTWIDMKYGILAAGIPLGAYIYSFSFIDYNNGYLETINKIYKTTDGGVTWTLDYTHTGAGNFSKIIATPTVVMATSVDGSAVRLGLSNTGITNIQDVHELSVYPNPSARTITLGSSLTSNENAYLEISDANSRIIKAEKISNNKVDVSAFATGIYFGKLTTNDGNYRFKFVKQ